MPNGLILTQHNTGQDWAEHKCIQPAPTTTNTPAGWVPTAALSVDNALVLAPAAQYTRHRQGQESKV